MNMKDCECCYSEIADCEEDLLIKEIGEKLIQKLKAYKNQQGDIWGKSIVQGAIDIIKEYCEVQYADSN